MRDTEVKTILFEEWKIIPDNACSIDMSVTIEDIRGDAPNIVIYNLKREYEKLLKNYKENFENNKGETECIKQNKLRDLLEKYK